MPISPDTAGIMTHQGQAGLHNQDTALSHAAMGTFDGGDIYHIMRTPSKPIDTITPSKGFFHESMFYSDFYNSDDWDKGKIGFETTFGQRFLNIVRYSRPYFQDTEINGLPTFEEDDANGWAGYKEYNDIFGDIIAICEFGDTLKVYQERKPSRLFAGDYQYIKNLCLIYLLPFLWGLGLFFQGYSAEIIPQLISRCIRPRTEMLLGQRRLQIRVAAWE